jgi:hypothetical protein
MAIQLFNYLTAQQSGNTADEMSKKQNYKRGEKQASWECFFGKRG